MAIEKGHIFRERDVFIDYPFEEVTYRWDHAEQKAYVRFYGAMEGEIPVLPDNRLFNDALLYGAEISRQEYEQGKTK